MDFFQRRKVFMVNKIPQEQYHQSIRGYFAGELHNLMVDDTSIVCVTADLGYKMLDFIQRDFPDRFYNVGASEQAGMGICVGMALNGLIPFYYSITPFLLYRSFETIRNYINHEKINVKLCGSGREQDYTSDGFSHYSNEAESILNILPNIKTYWPVAEANVTGIMQEIYGNTSPSFLSLKR